MCMMFFEGRELKRKSPKICCKLFFHYFLNINKAIKFTPLCSIIFVMFWFRCNKYTGSAVITEKGKVMRKLKNQLSKWMDKWKDRNRRRKDVHCSMWTCILFSCDCLFGQRIFAISISALHISIICSHKHFLFIVRFPFLWMNYLNERKEI